MKQRIISGVILVIALIPTLLIGGNFTGIVLAIVSLVGIYELLKVFKLEKSVPGIITYIADIIYYAILIINPDELNSIIVAVFILLFIALLITYVTLFPKYKALEIMSGLAIFTYAGMLLSYVYQIRSMDAGIYLVWMIFIASWICDTCAYFSGVFLGKHKAFPVLSPKKTWEGCIGGVIGSMLISLVFAIVFNAKLADVFSAPNIALPIITLVCSIISMFGDLAASAIKRDYGIKDYGTLIPGHGGIMDRFDSVIFVAPVVYYMITIIN